MLTIGKIAELSGLTTDAIRYYEKEGLVAPQQKSDAGYRLYDDVAVRRLHFIKQAQHCGFSLAEIQQLLTLQTLDSSCCSDVRKLAVTKKLQLEAKIRDLQAMSATLDHLIIGCAVDAESVDKCTILSSLKGQEHD
ncbi:heavy metal-responsive transcriptional regulator [Undibacterium sp. Jales W-56]|uniref:heavy metal-responsive transcriptional regulator n=1 Tax=Undibacterium sp. Jales W-56 TaxID=2897325 RepID=UPI0021CF12FD|nr:heavy metal-responsive transcriptional regulator [Undibacterium sp. Jales W-56]MCU6435252.1 heavy metal-responsive transcriptional regulator [Undibacterium sp. Jales W-56]